MIAPASTLAHMLAEQHRREVVADLLPGLHEDRVAESYTVAQCQCGRSVQVAWAQPRIRCAWCSRGPVDAPAASPYLSRLGR